MTNKFKKMNQNKSIVITTIVVLIAILIPIVLVGYFYKDDKKENHEQKATKTITTTNVTVLPLDHNYQQDQKKAETLTKEIEDYEKQLKEGNLTAENKKFIEDMLANRKKQLEEVKHKLNLVTYAKALEKEIKTLQTKITTSNPDDQLILSEQKLEKEKEILTLQQENKLFESRIKIQSIMKNLNERLKNDNLSTEDKAKLNNEKTKHQNKLKTEIQPQINKSVKRISLKLDLLQKQKELEEDISEETRTALTSYIETKKKELATL